MAATLERCRMAGPHRAIGGESDPVGRLLEGKLAAGPAQALIQYGYGGHHGTRRAGRAAGNAAPAPLAVAAARAARFHARGLRRELALHEALRVIAVGQVEGPSPAQIDTG